MNSDGRYTKFALVREMMETPGIIRRFKLRNSENVKKKIKQTRGLFLTGEGSSRIFPAKNAIAQSLKSGLDITLATEGSLQAAEYDLSRFVVFAASNSGRTKETIYLFEMLKKAGHKNLFGLTANKNTKLETLAEQTFILSCGSEEAIAATKSLVEQALFYQVLLAEVQDKSIGDKLDDLAGSFESALAAPVDSAVTNAVIKAETVYFAGRNDGVAEELAVKTNEIVRKKSDFLEGTSYMHGIQEVMSRDDVVFLIDPYTSELEKTRSILVDEVGLKVFAISDKDTIFPTIRVKTVEKFANYVYLAAGWNILVEAGIALGINLDKTERARKVGNVFPG
jgi:glucosamine--fructose-6-phosphate aminotransferase (isomerizing)